MHEIAALKLALVGLPADTAAKYPSELSGGMRKRAGLARALALDPEILFLDEPTSGLDPIAAAEFDTLVGDLRRSLGLTVLMVTHDLDSLYALADRVAILIDGRLKTGTLDELLRNDDPWIKRYFSGPRGRAARRNTPSAKEAKMETRASYVAVGVFVLALVTWALVAALWFARSQFTEQNARYDIYFASVSTGLVAARRCASAASRSDTSSGSALDPANASAFTSRSRSCLARRSGPIRWLPSTPSRLPARRRSKSRPAARTRRRSDRSRANLIR